MYLYQAINKTSIHIFQLQKFNTLHLENNIVIFLFRCLLIQVENFNSIKKFGIMMILWHVNDILQKLTM